MRHCHFSRFFLAFSSSIILLSVAAPMARSTSTPEAPSLEKADELLKDKQYVKAIDAYTGYVKAKPKDYKGFYGRSRAYIAMYQTNDCIDDINKAIALSPKNTELYKFRGERLIAWGEFDRAIKDLTFALDNGNPDKYELILDRAEAYRLLGNHAKVIEDLTRALSMKDDVDVHLKRGDSLFELRKYKLAVEDYSAYLQKHPTSHSQLFRRGFCLEQYKNYDAAIADYTKILEDNNLNAKALERRAAAYYAKGEYQKALKDCNTALGDFRGYSAAGLYKIRAQVYSKLGRGGQAAKDYSKIRRKKSR